MLFSSPVFLSLFLPIVLALYFAAPRAARNLLLLLASFVFYAWGEPSFVVVMLFSIAANFVRSVAEFWRRWHISLSTWFRDYLYIPLGGNRGAPWRTYVNLVTVFFLCGLWHGASWTFVGWGLFHGLFLVIERRGLGRWLAARAAPLGHVYTLFVVMIGWVFFRATTLHSALAMLAAMGGVAQGTGVEHYARLYLDVPQVLALVVGAVGALPVLPTLARWCNRRPAPIDGVLALASIAGLVFVFVSSAMMLAAGTYNPFIYFRF